MSNNQIRQGFKSVSHISDTRLLDQLEINLKTWMDWSFLLIGGWTDVAASTENFYGGDLSKLRLVNDPNYTLGQVWESGRKNWVWETGVNYTDRDGDPHNPVSPATILVNNVATVPDHINYELGRVVFSSAQPQNANVQANYSFRHVNILRAEDEEWWRELQYRSFNVEDSHFQQLDQGVWSVGSNHRVQMPCIILESVNRSDKRGYQLGDGAFWRDQDVICHVIADNKQDRNRLVDILDSNFDSAIWMFDTNLVTAAGDNPIGGNGDIVDSSHTYPYLVSEANGFRWEICRFANTQISSVESFNTRLFEGIVRLSCKFVVQD